MSSFDYTRLIEAFSLACLLGLTPLGVVCLIDTVLYAFQTRSFYCKVRSWRLKIDEVVNNEWVVATQCALITVLTLTLFVLFHSYPGENWHETFVRLIINPFFVF